MTERICRICGTVFTPPQSSEERGFYCGQRCYGLSRRTRVERTCQQCGATFWKKPVDIARGGGLYCTPVCYRASKVPVPLVDRVWPKVNKDGPVPAQGAEYGNCWLWTGARNSMGYGHIGRDGRTPLVSHVVWGFATGEEPQRGDILGHVCDTPLCVRNDSEGEYTVRGRTYQRRGHLFLATHQANAQDKIEKRRHGNAKVTDEMAQAIYDRYHRGGVTQMTLAAEYGLSQTRVSQIIRGESPHRRHASSSRA